MTREPLPIDDVVPEVIASLREHPSLVLTAPTGAGKTTRVPPALLNSELIDQTILLLEPRRIAARAAARRMCEERGTPLGETVGYQVRFERVAGKHTRILVVTPGILLRMLHDDPYLERVGVVLFDEFHERGLESDLALGILRLLQQTVRPDLRIVVMSATLDGQRISDYLNGCPVLSSTGRTYPVEVRYRPRGRDQSLAEEVTAAVEEMLSLSDGDVLTFLPGWQEIRQVARMLDPTAVRRDLLVLPLHGDLPPAEQDAALRSQPQRKIVLTTNVAETSVTVEGVTGVVDSGVARVLRLDLGVGLDRLEVEPISRASADQRAGRAGRTSPGLCIRLWSEANHLARPEQSEPEIRRVDLTGTVLQLLCLGEMDLMSFPWLDPPPAATVKQALDLLRLLGVVEDAGVTGLGRVLARFPVHPRLALLLVQGWTYGEERRAALAAAFLAERDPFLRSIGSTGRGANRHTVGSDLVARIEALEEFERSGNEETAFGTLNRNGAQFTLRARDQLLRTVRQEASWGRESPPSDAEPGEGVMRALLHAFPDRLARRREPGSPRGIMVGGRGVLLAPSSAVRDAELFLCIDIEAGERESFVRLASAVRRDWLPPSQVTARIELEFDAASVKVIARKRLRFADLLIEESPAALPDPEAVSRALYAAARDDLGKVLPAKDSEAGQFLTRIRCLGKWMPELGLPAFDVAELADLLTGVCQRRRSFAEVREGWLDHLRGRLTHRQLLAVEREAPEKLEVPTGSRLTLLYEEGRPPVLAVRIQELFGLTDTPRIAGGRLKVLLHLLAPNYRPQQVTDDLASFWANTYPQVRKDLRARYPKHAWPEDPLAANPERGPKRRKK